MKTYICTNFTGHNPVGTAAVIVAPSEEEADIILRKELAAHGLLEANATKTLVFTKLNKRVPAAHILNNGDY